MLKRFVDDIVLLWIKDFGRYFLIFY